MVQKISRHHNRIRLKLLYTEEGMVQIFQEHRHHLLKPLHNRSVPSSYFFFCFIFLIYEMTKKELVELLSNFDDNARISISVDDGYGMQCNADIEKVRELSPDFITLIHTPIEHA